MGFSLELSRPKEMGCLLFLAELPSGAPLASWEIKGNP